VALEHIRTSTQGSNISHVFGLNILYVLDARLRPVPLGCSGELFIGGLQLSRGYLKNPEQTFVDDPFCPGDTMCATGDLVHMSPTNGSITYLGHRDRQIKIRGFREEIGEIEVLKAASKLIVNTVILKFNIRHDTLAAFLEYPSDPESPNNYL
jgi:non-ribosomal peptide synthetase component F